MTEQVNEVPDSSAQELESASNKKKIGAIAAAALVVVAGAALFSRLRKREPETAWVEEKPGDEMTSEA